MNNMEKLKATIFGPTPSLPAPGLMHGGACSHNRQRQKRVGMKTPKATSIGNMRLLLSEA